MPASPTDSRTSCPECHSEKLHRSRRNSTFERLFFPRRYFTPYRCEDCNARFIVSHLGQDAPARKRPSRTARARAIRNMIMAALLIGSGLAAAWMVLHFSSGESSAPPAEQSSGP